MFLSAFQMFVFGGTDKKYFIRCICIKNHFFSWQAIYTVICALWRLLEKSRDLDPDDPNCGFCKDCNFFLRIMVPGKAASKYLWEKYFPELMLLFILYWFLEYFTSSHIKDK